MSVGLDGKLQGFRGADFCFTPGCLVANGGEDPYSSPSRIPNSQHLSVPRPANIVICSHGDVPRPADSVIYSRSGGPVLLWSGSPVVPWSLVPWYGRSHHRVITHLQIGHRHHTNSLEHQKP